MDEFLAMGTTSSGVEIYLSELSRKTLSDNGLDSKLGGLYLYEAVDRPDSFGIRVLASVPCMESGYRMMDILGLRIS